MGAFSELRWFDAVKLRDTVAPALRDVVEAGVVVGWLAEILASRVAHARTVESRFPVHFQRHRRPTAQLEGIAAGLGLSLLGRCELVRADLGVVDLPATLRRVRPAIAGACDSGRCEQRQRCPLHPDGQAVATAETFMGLCGDVVREMCFTGPEVLLGRRGQWHDLLGWYASELGRDPYDDADGVAVRYEDDPTLTLLLRLSRRGAAIGGGDGGYGEGLLGWLDQGETAALAEGLARYDLTPPEPWPNYPDPAASADLADMRAVVALIRDTGGRAASRWTRDRPASELTAGAEDPGGRSGRRVRVRGSRIGVGMRPWDSPRREHPLAIGAHRRKPKRRRRGPWTAAGAACTGMDQPGVDQEEYPRVAIQLAMSIVLSW
jgi:hypothetical protein